MKEEHNRTISTKRKSREMTGKGFNKQKCEVDKDVGYRGSLEQAWFK